jgi:hypothetical protein
MIYLIVAGSILALLNFVGFEFICRGNQSEDAGMVSNDLTATGFWRYLEYICISA